MVLTLVNRAVSERNRRPRGSGGSRGHKSDGHRGRRQGAKQAHRRSGLPYTPHIPFSASLGLETQRVTVDATGHYSVQLGTTLPNGRPKEPFGLGSTGPVETGLKVAPDQIDGSGPYAGKRESMKPTRVLERSGHGSPANPSTPSSFLSPTTNVGVPETPMRFASKRSRRIRGAYLWESTSAHNLTWSS